MIDTLDYNIIENAYPLNVARTRVRFSAGISDGLVISRYDDPNSLLAIQIGSSSAPLTYVREGYRFYFIKPFKDFYVTNIVGVGNIQIMLTKGVNCYLPPRTMSDISTHTVLEQQTAVGVAATPIPAVALNGRKKILVVNVGANPVFLGSATVTVANGIPLAPNGIYTDTQTENVILYGIVGAGAENVRVLEGA